MVPNIKLIIVLINELFELKILIPYCGKLTSGLKLSFFLSVKILKSVNSDLKALKTEDYLNIL